MHRHVPLHIGAVAEANVLPQVLTQCAGHPLEALTGCSGRFPGIWRRAAPGDAWSGGQDSGSIR